MSVDRERPHPERESTNGSLRTERRMTDFELSRGRHTVQQDAADIVDRARDAASEVLRTARALADGITEEQTAAGIRVLRRDRARADDLVRAERLRAEHLLADEGGQRAREIRDIVSASTLHTERELTDENLHTERGRSDEEVGTRDLFLAMVCHDLRSLLGGIALTAEMLARESAPDGDGENKVRSRAKEILRFSARMNRIVGDLVDIASIEAGKLVVKPARLDLTALVKDAIGMLESSADARQITIALDPATKEIQALIDRDRIAQVLLNLLTNAIKFTPEGGRIDVRVEARPGEARVSIADTGPGIAAENLDAVFGRFWQVGGSDRSGLGLGLYIARCIMEGHRGRIWAESVVGVGSTFIFTVPRA